MISDDDLYRLAIFLGSCAMMMTVLYHFLDVNATDENESTTKPVKSAAESTSPSGNTRESTASSEKGK